MPLLAALRREFRGIVLSPLLVAGMTGVLIAVRDVVDLTDQPIIYLIPIIAAATWWGILSAITAALASVGAVLFFFYPPIYSFAVAGEDQALNLILFLFVAIVTGRLATTLKRQAEVAAQREADVADLYAFSRRLAAAPSAAEIYVAIQDHLTKVIQQEVVLFASGAAPSGDSSGDRRPVPEPVRKVVAEIAGGPPAPGEGQTVDSGDGNIWLVRRLSPKHPDFGVIAVNFGRGSARLAQELRQRVDAVLADATATLERLDIARAITEARMRAETDLLREALIGSVSHELRTPLSSILGAATVLGQAPPLKQDSRLAALVNLVRDEADRLNSDIQNLLDATRISREGIRPRLEWAEPADIINSALERRSRRLVAHRVALDVRDDLPLVYVDPVLVEQALLQILDNAAKYSPPGSTIAVSARQRDEAIELSVGDEGVGLTDEERAHIGERFFRGRRHAAAVAGSGLGLWIATAFIAANNGRLQVASEGAGRGATISIRLPVPDAMMQSVGGPDE